MKERIISIDVLKGFTILCVVLGYAIQFSLTNPFENHLLNYISSFQMPLFMFLSGFVMCKSNFSLNRLQKRLYQLLVPFFTFAIITALIRNGNFEIVDWYTVISSPDKGLWFLLILFYISTLFTIIYNFGGRANTNINNCSLMANMLRYWIK